MQGKSDLIHIKRKSLLYFVITVLILGIVTPVLADYLGPDRTTTTSEVDTYDYGVWARDNNKAPYCLDKKGNKADDCIVCEWKRKPGSACGDATYSYKLGTISEVVEKTINLPPAAISSSLQNCNSNNGWCNTLPTLTLNGSEPLAGYNILAVEGSLNGQTFACSGSSCDVPLSEGNNDLTFWALSSYGDSSEMGSLSAKVDAMSPNVGLDVIGSNGTNTWYVSSTTVTAIGSDSTSGLSSVLLSVNGGAWTASTTLNDGVYAVDVHAVDNAGNVSNSSTTISVDTVTPSISLNVNGAMGGNGWYSSNMQVTASASDLTSGIASLEVSADSGLYQAYTSPVSFTDGYHTIQFKATDNAGNQTETPIQEFYVDTTAPAIDLLSSWEVNKTIGYNIQDDGSGLAALRIVIEDEDEKYKKVTWDEEVSGDKFKGEITWNGKFRDGTVAPPGEYLVWIKAKDQAGNERFGLGRVIVPQPAVFSLLQPTITNNQEPLLPPQELFDEDELPIANSSLTTPPQTSFGGLTTDPKEVTQNSLLLATGTASASTSSNSNILWGATAAALIGWATATALEEKKKRKALHRASRDEAEQVKARASRDEEPSLTRQEKELAKQRKELQKIWDANGAAIYEANREYKTKHGKEMDAAARSKAIKDATRDGVFNAGAYASNLEAEQMRRDAQNEHMANKMTRFEKEEEAHWQASQKAAEEKRKAEELQAGYAAYYAAMRQGEQEAQTNWWDKAVDFAQENIVEPIQKTWNTVTTFVQDKIVEPVVIVLDERVYQPYIKPAAEKIKEVVKESAKWINEHIYQPYIKPVVDTVKNNANMAMETVQNGWASLFSLFQTHPTAAWATAGTVTLAAIAGTTYYLNCLGQPIFTPPAVSLFNLASIGALPVAGVLTTGKKKRFHGIVVGLLLLGMLLSACGTGNVPSVPTTTPTLCPSTETPVPIPPTVPPTATTTPIPFTLPPAVYVVQPNDVCINIAVRYGITVDEFVEANNSDANPNNQIYYVPNTDPNKVICIINAGIEYIIPSISYRTPAEYVNYWQGYCIESEKDGIKSVCLSPNDSPSVMLAHTLYGEGGSSINALTSANVMQVAINRINSILRNRGIRVESLSLEQYQSLILYVISQPYDYETEDGQSGQEPAFNAFNAPYPHQNSDAIETNWDQTLQVATMLMESPAYDPSTGLLVWPNNLPVLPFEGHPEIAFSVTSYCATPTGVSLPMDEGTPVYIEYGQYSTQYYFNDGTHHDCK